MRLPVDELLVFGPTAVAALFWLGWRLKSGWQHRRAP